MKYISYSSNYFYVLIRIESWFEDNKEDNKEYIVANEEICTEY